MSILNNKKFTASIVSLFIISLIPVLSFAAIVTCDGSAEKPCNFNAFVTMVNGIIDWIIGIATSIFTISAIYGGFLYMTSGENPGNKQKAKSILTNTLIGFIIILSAWLIVYTIITTLVPQADQKNAILRFFNI